MHVIYDGVYVSCFYVYLCNVYVYDVVYLYSPLCCIFIMFVCIICGGVYPWCMCMLECICAQSTCMWCGIIL